MNSIRAVIHTEGTAIATQTTGSSAGTPSGPRPHIEARAGARQPRGRSVRHMMKIEIVIMKLHIAEIEYETN